MTFFWFRRSASLLVSTSMVIVGYLGLVGEIQNSTTLLAAILATIVGLTFSFGHQAQLKNT